MANKLSQKVTGAEYDLRKSLDLPVTKELRYMQRTGAGYEEIKVMEYWIAETFPMSQTHVLEMVLENGETKKVFSSFFAEMQKPSFEKDMLNQMAEMAKE